MKRILLHWMEKNCNGYRNAKTKEQILTQIPIAVNERKFRELMSELKHEGHIASNSRSGYWFIPLYSNDNEEVAAVLDSWYEMRSRALNMLTDTDRVISELRQKLSAKRDLFDKAGV